MSANLLLVEDDHSLGATLKERLEKAGYQVEWTQTCAGAEAATDRLNFDLVIFDVGLPDGSGFDIAAKIKEATHTPFIFMTALNSAENRLQGYELGAEEFIPKPFHLKELLLRVQHVLEMHPPARSKFNIGSRTLDLTKMTIEENGQVEYIPTRDFQILKLLIDRSPRAVSRDDILNQAWGEDQFPSHRTVDNAIVRLRQLIGDQKGEWIRSVRGIGYQWVNKE